MSSAKNGLLIKLQNRYLKALIYKRTYKFAFESQYWSEADWQKWQWAKLKSLLEYAYQSVPYYQKMFVNMGIVPDDIRNWNDFKSIPILTKEIVRSNEKDLFTLDSKERKKAIQFSSSGSTGLPLSFYTSREQQIATNAFMDYQWFRIGYKPRSTRVIIRGLFSPKLIEKMSSHLWNITVHGLAEKNLSSIKDYFDTVQPQYIHAFPSSLWTLTNLFLEHSLTLNYIPQGLLMGSERYPLHYRELFESFYKCKSYSWLGLAEGTILAGECEFSHNLHIIPGYSYVELEENTEDSGFTGNRIIGTSFYNRAFPFIRYYCGDLAMPDAPDCECKRGYQIIKSVVGRDSEFFITRDGRELSLTALYSAIHGDVFEGIVECQFIQKEPGKVETIIVRDKNYKMEFGQCLIDELNKRSGDRLRFTAVFKNELIKTPTGKLKLLIQEIKKQN